MKILIEKRKCWDYRCPLMGGVRLREVLVSGGSTEATTRDRTPWDT